MINVKFDVIGVIVSIDESGNLLLIVEDGCDIVVDVMDVGVDIFWGGDGNNIIVVINGIKIGELIILV